MASIFVYFFVFLLGIIVGFLRVDLLLEKIYFSKEKLEEFRSKALLKWGYFLWYFLVGSLNFYLIDNYVAEGFENLAVNLIGILISFYLFPFIAKTKYWSFEGFAYLLAFQIFNNYLALGIFLFLFIASFIYKKDFTFAVFSSLTLGGVLLVINSKIIMKANILKIEKIESFIFLLIAPIIILLTANYKLIANYFETALKRKKENKTDETRE